MEVLNLWKWPFCIIDNTKVKLTEDIILKLKDWYWIDYINWNISIIETDKSIKIMKEKKIELIDKEFKNTIKLLTAWYSKEEQDWWNSQLEWAKSILVWGTSLLLETIVIETWEDIQILAQNIINKADFFEIEYARALWIKRAKINLLT